MLFKTFSIYLDPNQESKGLNSLHIELINKLGLDIIEKWLL